MTPHRSRTFWPAPLGQREPRPPLVDDKTPPYHSHRQPRVLWVIAFVCIVVLSLICGLLMAYAVRVDDRLAALEEYVDGRGEYRDREAARMESEWQERLRQAQCDLLDQFPEGGWLTRPREKYGCGPGIPISELPPEEQKELAGRHSNVAPAPAPAELSPFGTPIIPDSSSPAPQRKAAQPPQPAPEPGPLVDPSPVTDLVCGVVAACP